MNHKNYYVLSNGVKVPPVGFGTDRTFIYLRKNMVKGALEFGKDILFDKGYHFKRDCSIYKVIKGSMACGCSLFDTASAYGQSERVLGRAVRDFSREDIFIITKLSNQEQREGNVEAALRRSLKKMGLEKVDLYLMHWPQSGTYIDCWKQMEEVYEKGLARSIGVCNFKQHHFEELRKSAKIMPMVNQIESHPLFSQEDMAGYCRENHIQMMAYTPTGRMDERVRTHVTLQSLAQKYNTSIAQVIIRWHYQRGVIPIINTTSLSHLRDNMNVFDFELTEDEMWRICDINIDCRLRYDPDTVDFTKC